MGPSIITRNYTIMFVLGSRMAWDQRLGGSGGNAACRPLSFSGRQRAAWAAPRYVRSSRQGRALVVSVEIARPANAKDAIAAVGQICGIYGATIEALFRAVSLPVAASDQRSQGVSRISERGLFGSPL